MLDKKDRPGKVFVGGLAIDVDESQLEQLFGKFGRITEILVIRDKVSNQSRGFGFVTYENPLDAVDAEKEMNGKDYKHRSLYVSQATKPRTNDDQDRSSRGGGSFGRGRGGSRGGSSFPPRGRGTFGGGRGGRSDRSPPPFSDSRDRFSPSRSRPSRGGGIRSGPPRGGGRDSLSSRGGSYSNRGDRFDDYGDRPPVRDRTDRFDDFGDRPPVRDSGDRYGSSRREPLLDNPLPRRREPLLESPLGSRRRDAYSPPREYGGRPPMEDRPILREDFSPPRDAFGSRSREFDDRAAPSSRGRLPLSRPPPVTSRPPPRDPMDRDALPSRGFRDDFDSHSRDYPPTRSAPSRDYPEARDRAPPSRGSYGDRSFSDTRDHYDQRSRSPGIPSAAPRSRAPGLRDPLPPRSSYPPPSSSSRSYSDQDYTRPPPSRSPPPMPRSGGDRYGDRDTFAGSRRPAVDSRGPPIKKPRMDDFRPPMDDRRRAPPPDSRRGGASSGHSYRR